MQARLSEAIHFLSRESIGTEHIRDEIGRHVSVLKYSAIPLAAFLAVALALLNTTENKLYFDMAFMGTLAFVAASFLPDLVSLASVSLKLKNAFAYYRLAHSFAGLVLFSIASIIFFSFFFSFERSLFISFLGFAGYGKHLIIDMFERVEDFCCMAIDGFLEKYYGPGLRHGFLCFR